MLGGLLRACVLASNGTSEGMRAVDVKIKAMRVARQRLANSGSQRARALEDDLGRVALLARALAEVCIKKGLLTPAELGQMMTEVDMADGASDGKLDPEVAFPGEHKLANLAPHTPQPKPVRKKSRGR
ncbi:MAG TPA: hypothetical protein VK843_04495 [Planctomycetota bacterium]|nr:hypothetical protein [Planctomycetota bacterium]